MVAKTRIKSPRRYVHRAASLRSVFPDDNMHAQIARLLVLYEDLKIESSGIGKKRMPSLSRTNDSQYPKRYFLRKAIATVSECANCMISLDRNPQFKKVKKFNFSTEARAAWAKAIVVCKKKSDKWLIKEIRNDVGGHFGVQAARRALKGFREGTNGKIDYTRDFRTSRSAIGCHFVGEITARAFVKDQDKDPEAQFRKLLEVFVKTQGVISRAIVLLIYCYVWPRFGRF